MKDDSSSSYSPFCYKLETEKFERYLFCKIHEAESESALKPAGRTLLVLNVPQYLNEEYVSDLFRSFGDIEKVYLHRKPTSKESDVDVTESKHFESKKALGHRVAYIVFKNLLGLKKALNAKAVKTLTVKKTKLDVGARSWAEDYNQSLLDTEQLLKEVEAYVANYDKKSAEEKEEALKAEGVPDEEGWVKVTRQSKRPKIPLTDAASRRIAARQARQRAKTTLLNFYRFQIREANSDQIAELRKKFQADKERVAAMRENRKFKPF